MSEFFSGNNRFYYEVHGSGDSLVLIAGFTCDSSFWEGLVEEFQKHYQVIIFDNRGVGRSVVTEDAYRIDEMAEDTLALFAHLNLKKVNLLGHSMGGAIAQTIAHKRPDSVNKLILSNTSAKFRSCSISALVFLYQLKMNQATVQQQAEFMLPWLFSDSFLERPETSQSIIEGALQNPHPQTLEGYKSQLHALMHFDARKWLLSVNLPTLIVAGGEDRLCLKDFEELQLLLPQSQTLYFPSAGHTPFAEEPEKFVRGVLDFLRAMPADVIPSL